MKRSVRPRAAAGARKVKPTLSKGPKCLTSVQPNGTSTEDQCEGVSKKELVVVDIGENSHLIPPDESTKTGNNETNIEELKCNITGIRQQDNEDGLRKVTPGVDKSSDGGKSLALPKSPLTDSDSDFPTAREQLASPPKLPTPSSALTPVDPTSARFHVAREVPSRQPTPFNKRPLMATMQPGCRSRADDVDRYRKPRSNQASVIFTLELQNRAKVQYMIVNKTDPYYETHLIASGTDMLNL